MRLFLPLLFSLVCLSCATTQPGAAQDAREKPYLMQIREWQQRIQKEGWGEGQVSRILSDCIRLVEYRVEIDDHWDTPQEFIRRGFRGDCEDIAIFLMGTLRRLRYPHGIRIVAVTGLFEAHALLKVEMPDGTWRFYDTAASGSPFAFHTYYRPVVEFDEKTVFYYGKQS